MASQMADSLMGVTLQEALTHVNRFSSKRAKCRLSTGWALSRIQGLHLDLGLAMSWVEEAYYLRLPSGSPMQGDIWSNLPQPYSSSPLCAGLVITPRCDLVHDKTLTANYLPLFPLNEFMETRGHHELLEQGLHDAEELLRRAADPLGVKEAVEWSCRWNF